MSAIFCAQELKIERFLEFFILSGTEMCFHLVKNQGSQLSVHLGTILCFGSRTKRTWEFLATVQSSSEKSKSRILSPCGRISNRGGPILSLASIIKAPAKSKVLAHHEHRLCQVWKRKNWLLNFCAKNRLWNSTIYHRLVEPRSVLICLIRLFAAWQTICGSTCEQYVFQTWNKYTKKSHKPENNNQTWFHWPGKNHLEGEVVWGFFSRHFGIHKCEGLNDRIAWVPPWSLVKKLPPWQSNDRSCVDWFEIWIKKNKIFILTPSPVSIHLSAVSG